MLLKHYELLLLSVSYNTPEEGGPTVIKSYVMMFIYRICLQGI